MIFAGPDVAADRPKKGVSQSVCEYVPIFTSPRYLSRQNYLSQEAAFLADLGEARCCSTNTVVNE